MAWILGAPILNGWTEIIKANGCVAEGHAVVTRAWIIWAIPLVAGPWIIRVNFMLARAWIL